MLALKTDSDFRKRPTGGYVAGASWLYFCIDLDLFGFVLWEAPEADDMAAFVRVMELELADRPPHAAIVDVRRLRLALAPSFGILADWFRANASGLGRVVTKCAIVKHDDLAGAVAAGFLGTVPFAFPATYWNDLETAVLSLERREGAAEIAAAIDRAQSDAAGTPWVLKEIQIWLEQHLQHGTLDAAAKSLAMAPRTLQRRLGEAKTSFAAEQQRARIRVAQRMLTDTDAPITTIAIDIGCASPQHFSSLFRKVVGETPTAWRKKMLGS
jgi:AraC-like DNA-binding protein